MAAKITIIFKLFKKNAVINTYFDLMLQNVSKLALLLYFKGNWPT